MRNSWPRVSSEYPLLGVLLTIFCAIYFGSTSTHLPIADTVGYVYGGIKIAETGQPSFYDPNNELIGPYFTPHAFRVRISADNPNFYLNYPVGFPLLIALTRIIVPYRQAVFYVAPSLAMVGIAGTFALGRCLFGKVVGFASAFLLAISPVYLEFSTDSWSDVPATALLVAATAAMVYGSKRGSLRAGIVSGLLLGYACLIRYVTVLALVPFSFYLLYTLRAELFKSRFGYGLLAGFTLLLITILAYNRVFFGGFLSTGYSTKFGWIPWPALHPKYFLGPSPIPISWSPKVFLADSSFAGGGRSFLGAMSTLLHDLGFLLPIMVVGCLTMRRAELLLLGGIAAAFIGFYSFYAWAPNGNGARFLVPSLPMIYVATGRGISCLADKLAFKSHRALILSVVIAFLLIPEALNLVKDVELLRLRNESYLRKVRRAELVAATTEPNAVIISQYLHDQIIIYGHRSSVAPSILAVPDPAQGRYVTEAFAPALIELVEDSLERRIPVYLVPEGLPPYMRLPKPFDILSPRFVLVDQGTEATRFYRILASAEEAIELLEEAIRTSPLSPQLHQDLGQAYASQGRWEEAIIQYEEAIGLRPGDARYHVLLGDAYLASGRAQQAVGEYESALALSPELDQKAWFRRALGDAYLASGRAQQAAEEYEAALTLKPNLDQKVWFHLRLGKAYTLSHQVEKAIQEYERVLTLDPDNPTAIDVLERLR